MDIPVTKTSSWIKPPKAKIGISICALLIIAVMVSYMFSPALPSVKQSEVWTSKVLKGDFTRKVRGVGVLAPAEIRWIAANSAGRVERVLVQPGALVSRDTVIAELSNPTLLNNLQQAQWELDAAVANLLALEAQMQEQALEQELAVTQAKMALATAELQERAEQPLADKNIISDLDFATTKLTTQQRQAELDIRLKTQVRREEVVKAKLAAEQAIVRKYQNMLDHLKSQHDALAITADIDGVLQQVSVDVGERVNAGSNIARVAQPDSLLAQLQVQENLVKDLRIGLPVTIDTRNGLVAGRVKRIDPRVTNGNVQVDVELVESLPPGSRPDLSVTGSIIVEQINDALYIDRPAGAVSHSETQLFLVDDSGLIAKQHSIQLGKASVATIQVIEGLRQGDRVIVSDMSAFKQHSAIKLIQ